MSEIRTRATLAASLDSEIRRLAAYGLGEASIAKLLTIEPSRVVSGLGKREPPKPVVTLGRPLRLAAVRCEGCGGQPVEIVGVPGEDTLPLRCFCCISCAAGAGWPWLAAVPERPRRMRSHSP
jgi:hypothetical protein